MIRRQSSARVGAMLSVARVPAPVRRVLGPAQLRQGPRRAFGRFAAGLVDRRGDLALLRLSLSSPLQVQFLQSASSVITHVDIDGKTFFDGSAPRVELPMPTARREILVTVRVTDSRGAPSVEVGGFAASNGADVAVRGAHAGAADTTSPGMSYWTMASYAGTGMGVYHGYMRTKSVGGAIAWALFGGFIPILAIPLMFAFPPGFGKFAGK